MNSNREVRCHLPLELLRNIVTNIQLQASLLPVALASSVLREEAQRRLFMAPQLPTPLSHLVFLNTVIASPHRLALSVKTYTQFGVLDDAEPTPQLMQTLSDRTAAALQVMVNLRKLGFRATFYRVPNVATADILRGCTFQLHALTWVCHANDAEILLHEILPSQKALRHLGLLCPGELSSGDIQAAKLLCADLVSLAGPISIFPVLLPNRSIRYLHWTLGRVTDDEDGDIASLPSEFFDIEFLVSGIHSEIPLRAMTTVLRSVKHLTIFWHDEVRPFSPHCGFI